MLTLPSHTSHGLQPLDVSCFKPFKVAFRAYKNAWCVKNRGMKVRKEDLVHWLSLAYKKALINNNIKAGFKGTRIWPLNFQAMQSKMGPSESFLHRSSIEVAQEEQVVAEILGEGILPPPSNPTHFYVDNEDEDDMIEELFQEEQPTHHNISTFLRLPQEKVARERPICEPLIDYSQSQIVTSDAYVETIENIAQKKKKDATKKETKRLEKEQTKQTKQTREAQRQKKRKEKEKRAHDRVAKRMGNTTEGATAQAEAKKWFKAKWTVGACEEAGQHLHDLIKQKGVSSNLSPYLGRQPLA